MVYSYTYFGSAPQGTKQVGINELNLILHVESCREM
jgi:hypothetical protein